MSTEISRSWLWPDHVIGKRESRQLREEHNALVNAHAKLLDIVRGLLDEIDRCGVKVSPELERAAREAVPGGYRAQFVTLADANLPAFWAMLAPGNWNGYARPYFNRGEGEHICALMLANKIATVANYDGTRDQFVFELDGTDYRFKAENINGAWLYPIGLDCWCWVEKGGQA